MSGPSVLKSNALPLPVMNTFVEVMGTANWVVLQAIEAIQIALEIPPSKLVFLVANPFVLPMKSAAIHRVERKYNTLVWLCVVNQRRGCLTLLPLSRTQMHCPR